MLQLVHWYSFKVKSSQKKTTNGRIIFPTWAHCINLVSFVGWCKFPHVFSKIFVLRSLHDSVGDADEVSKFDLLQAFQDDARSAAPRYQIFTFQKRVVEKAPAPVFRRFSLQLGDVKDVAMCSSHDMCLKILKKCTCSNSKVCFLVEYEDTPWILDGQQIHQKKRHIPLPMFRTILTFTTLYPAKNLKNLWYVHCSRISAFTETPTPHHQKTTDNQSVIHLEGLLETIHGPLAFHCRSDFSNLSMKWKKMCQECWGFVCCFDHFLCWMFLLAGPGIAFWFAFGAWRRESLKKHKPR